MTMRYKDPDIAEWLPVEGKDGAFKTMGGDTVAQAIPDLEDHTAIAAQWGNFSQVDWAGGDFVTSVAGVNGQAVTVLSGSPLTTGESAVVNTNRAVLQPCALEFAGSFVRTGISFATASLFANDPVTGPDSVPAPINIVSYYQSSAVLGATNTGSAGTVMHMLLESPLPAVGTNQAVFVGDWINVTGLVDARFNYPNACINYISPDRKTIAVGFSDEAALPSIVFPAGVGNVQAVTLGTAKVNFYNNMSGARNGLGLRFTGITATSAAVVSIFGGDDNQVSGTLLGDHRVTIASSAPAYAAGSAWGQAEIRATSRYLLECTPSAALVMDKPEQTQAQWIPRDIPRTSVKPASGAALYPRFRLYKPVSMTRPVAKIVSAAHAAASTATVVTLDIAPSVAGLQINNWVTLRGVRDQTNFANSATAVQITALNEGANQITVAWGTAVIATSYGGAVIQHHGGRDQPGIIAGAIQSVVSRTADGGNWLDVIGNSTWTGAVPGDYINLHGVRYAVTGADLGLDGAWEVAHISTTTMVCKPVFNIAGAMVSPALGTLTSTNCGGVVILRPTLRAHDLALTSWGESRVSIDGAGTMRADKAMPVILTTSPSVAQGTAASIGTGGAGAWFVRGGGHVTNDIPSAALTAVGQTTSSVVDLLGNTGAMQYTVEATSVSGTSPRQITRIQGSFDNVGYVNVYDLGVLTNSTDKKHVSPVLPVEFRSMRYVRDLRGTTPSITQTINRTMRPLEDGRRQRRMIDRVVSLTATTASTEWLYVGGCAQAQMMVTAIASLVGTSTVKAQACQGDPTIAGNWYDIPGAPTLSASASAAVVTAVFNIGAAKFMRLVPTAAATTATADTYELVLTAWE